MVRKGVGASRTPREVLPIRFLGGGPWRSRAGSWTEVYTPPIRCWMNTASWKQAWSSKQWTRWVKRTGKKASITGQTRNGDAWTKVSAEGKDRKWLQVFPVSFQTHAAPRSLTQGWLLQMTSTVLWLFAWCWPMESTCRRWITLLAR